MKHIILSTVLIIATLSLHAQSSSFDRYFDKYQDDERFTQVNISSKMFSLFVNFEVDDPDEQALVETISKLKGLKMLIGSDEENAMKIFNSAVKGPSREMDELMSIKDGDMEFNFFITETKGKISELVMVGREQHQLFLLSLLGEIDLQQLAALSKKMNISGFQHFEKLEE